MKSMIYLISCHFQIRLRETKGALNVGLSFGQQNVRVTSKEQAPVADKIGVWISQAHK